MVEFSVLDLFSGIGGISLGLERTGKFRTIGFCEIDQFCRLVLEKHWQNVPIWGDIRDLSAETVRRRCGRDPDIIAGGFPCQPHSVAGKRKGQADERHLWPEFARLVREIRPRWVLAENVPGIRTTAADEVISDLEAEGYTVWPLVVGADDVGAPHRRKRVWFVAHRDGRRCTQRNEEIWSIQIANEIGWPSRPGEPQHEWEEPRLAYVPVPRLPHCDGPGARATGQRDAEHERRGGSGGAGAWSPEQPLGGPTDGLSLRLVRRANREALKAYGNSVVPQVVKVIGRAIIACEEA